MVATRTKTSCVSIKTIVRVARTAILALVAGYLLFCVMDLIISPPGKIRFTLTFEDRPIPDISSYQALCLHGEGFDYHKNACHEDVLYNWFARALFANNLSMALTYRGYAQSQNRGSLSPEHDLKDRAAEFVIRTQTREHEVGSHGRNFDGISLDRLIGVLSDVLPDGAPYPWVLPKIKGKCYSKIVWDAAYWDLVSQHGSEDEKRHILSVEADYDWGTRLRVNGHVPSIGFEEVDIGFRLVFRDGVDGSVFARLDVKYPNAHSLFEEDALVCRSCDSIMRLVFSEMKKGENLGRTIEGRFVSFDGVDKVYVEGQDKPVLSVEISTRTMWQEYFDLQGAVEVPDGAYAGCSSIREVEIPSTVTNLGAWAFAGCSALRHVTLPSSIREISDGLFYRGSDRFDREGLESVAIPDTVRRIGKYAFASNTRLTEIELPESVEEIDDYAFYRCESLTNVVIKGGALKRIGEAAFWGCEKLKRPELPSSVEIGEEAFGGWIP